MNLLDKILAWLKGGKKEEAVQAEPQAPARIKKTCKKCGKTFSVDPNWEHIPNYCKDCKRSFAKEKEQRQKQGPPRKITRKCRNCGKFFTFPSTLQNYPNYCNDCRKRRQTQMKEKYGKPVNRTKNDK